MASDSERTEDAPWDELEQGFFAAAPPDVPVPPPEPMRFDDLDPLPSKIPQHRRADASRRLTAWRASAAVSAGAAWRRLTPVLGAASAASRRSALRVAAIGGTLARAGQARLPQLLAVFRNSSRQTRVLAASVAALVAVTGVSAGVVASRGSVRPVPTCAPLAIASSHSVAPEIAPPPVAPVPMTLVPDEDPTPASTSIAPGTTTPGPRKRKHAKAPARPPERPKALSKSSSSPSAPRVPGR